MSIIGNNYLFMSWSIVIVYIIWKGDKSCTNVVMIRYDLIGCVIQNNIMMLPERYSDFQHI